LVSSKLSQHASRQLEERQDRDLFRADSDGVADEHLHGRDGMVLEIRQVKHQFDAGLSWPFTCRRASSAVLQEGRSAG
jgi:hypothetical protein